MVSVHAWPACQRAFTPDVMHSMQPRVVPFQILHQYVGVMSRTLEPPIHDECARKYISADELVQVHKRDSK